MISICMATYNGEAFIEEQLKCIYEQTLSPDEVIICDDDSADGTRDMIRAFIAKHNLQEKWHLIHNQERKGYPGNFYYCMSLAKGDIVFLADQDDVWSVEKLEKMYYFIQQNNAIQVLACKMELIDTEGKDIKTLIKPNYSAQSEQMQEISLDKVLYKNEWSGMVLAYRNQWYQNLRNKIQHTKLPHDLAICILAAAEQGMYQLDCVLAWHRRHDNNAAGEEHRVLKLLDKERKISDIEKYAGYLGTVLEKDIVEESRAREVIAGKYDQMQKRKELLKAGKCVPVLKNFLKNPKEIRLFTVICDFLICLRD